MMKGNIEKKPKRKDIFSKLNFKLNLGGEDPGKIVKHIGPLFQHHNRLSPLANF